MAKVAQLGEQRVELVGRDVARVVLVDGVDGIPDSMNRATGLGRDGDDGRVTDELEAIANELSNLIATIGIFDEVPLVDEHDHRATAFGGHARDLLVGIGQSERRVNHEEHDIGTVDRA